MARSRHKHSINKGVLEDDFIHTNYEFEKSMVSQMSSEVEEFKEFLEFVFENKVDELTIRRIVRTEFKDKYSNKPIDYYECGSEYGTYYLSDEEEIGLYDNNDECYDNSDIKFKKLNWVEWEITYANGHYYDDFAINITPHLFKIVSCHNESKKNKETLHLFTDEIYNIWNTRLEVQILKHKKRKVPKILEHSYKLLGIDRKAKIKKLLGE